MPLVTALTRDPTVEQAIRGSLQPDHEVAVASSWERLMSLIHLRPATAAVLDRAALDPLLEPHESLADLRARFPSVATVFVNRSQLDPVALFRLGRAGIEGLALVDLDGLASGLRGAMREALQGSTEARVTRAIQGRLPRRHTAVIRLAINGVQLGWDAEDLARRCGYTRAHLSVGLRAFGLPSAGHLLLWAKLLHAGRWLTDPARSAESVSVQLEYASGAGFRRALSNYVGCTPTAVKEGGGLWFVLDRFLDVCGLRDSVRVERSVA